MARRDGVPVDVPPAVVASLPGGRKPKGPDIRELPYDGKPYFGAKGQKPKAPTPRKRPGQQQVVWHCGRCNRGAVPVAHECQHGAPCRYVYEDTMRGQKAVAIECGECDEAAR